MKKTKTILLSMLFVMVLALGGCIRMESSVVVDEEDKVTINGEVGFDKAKTDAKLEELAQQAEYALLVPGVAEEFEKLEVRNIDGVEYYMFTEEAKTYTQEELKQLYPTYIINKDKCYIYISASTILEDALDSNATDNTGAVGGLDTAGMLGMMDLGAEIEALGFSADSIEYAGLSVSLASEITSVDTRGSVKEGDDKTAYWNLTEFLSAEAPAEEYELYAYTKNDPGDPAADKQTVLDQLQAWKESQATPTPIPTASPSASPAPSILPVIPIISEPPKADQKAPVIKGIKKNKTYKKKVTVYVKDNHKLKKVTLNGKKVKLKKVTKGRYQGYFKFTVKKKGKYTVVARDAAGNKKKIRFRIK